MIRALFPALFAAVISMPTAWAGAWPDVDQPLRSGQRASHDAALVIGSERYDHLPRVPHADQDARAAYLWLLHTRGVPVDRIQRLTDPALPQLQLAIQEAVRRVEEGGVLWVFYAGHASVEPTSGKRILLATNVPEDFSRLERYAFPVESIEELASESAAEHTLLVLDTSFSGIGREGEHLTPDVQFDLPHTPATADRVTTWVAANARQAARAHPTVGHGLFTWSVLGALRGWADGALGQSDGRITLDEAQIYVTELFETLGVAGHQDPNRDLRPSAMRIPLSLGRLARAPDLTDLPPIEIENFVNLPFQGQGQDAAAAEQRRLERAQEDEIRKQVQEQADRDWSRALTLARMGDERGQEALYRFIETYDARSYTLAHGDLVVTARQVHEARAMLRGTRTVQPTPVASLEPTTFWMGAAVGERDALPNELAHRVTLTQPFAIGLTEVTQDQWVDVMGYNPSYHRGTHLPVDSVTWLEAVTFCNALSRLEGYDVAYEISGRKVTWREQADGYRLPTEAEWELASGKQLWSGFDEPRQACTRANLLDQPDPDEVDLTGGVIPAPCSDGRDSVAPVRRYLANEHGLYDMTGNLAEWVWDSYAPHRAEDVTDPAIDSRSGARVLKGGSYRSGPARARSAARENLPRTSRSRELGFRVARTLPPEAP